MIRNRDSFCVRSSASSGHRWADYPHQDFPVIALPWGRPFIAHEIFRQIIFSNQLDSA